MLREVVNKHIKPRLIPFQLTTTSGGATVNIGYGDITATRPTTAGAGVITPRMGYSRNGFILLSQGTTDGGYAVYNTTTGSGTSFPYAILDAAGSATEGTCEGFLFGFDSSDTNLVKTQRVAATNGAPRIIWGKVTGSSGAVAIGTSDFSVTRSAAGTYVVLFKKAFGMTPCVMVTAIATAAASTAKVSSKTALGCTVTLAPETGTPTDADFYIAAIGNDTRSDSARGRMPLLNSQRKPRVLVCEITNTGGTPTLTIGGATGGTDFTSLTDNGAGDFSVTIAEPYKREPAIFVTTTTQRGQVHSYAANVVRVQTRDALGAAADTNGVTRIFVIGSDDGAQY